MARTPVQNGNEGKNLEKAFGTWFTVGADLDSRLADCRGQGQPLVGSWQLQQTTTAKRLAWNTSRACTLLHTQEDAETRPHASRADTRGYSGDDLESKFLERRAKIPDERCPLFHRR